jgi:hypothetical protein
MVVLFLLEVCDGSRIKHKGHTVRTANTGGTPVRDGKGYEVNSKFHSFMPHRGFRVL